MYKYSNQNKNTKFKDVNIADLERNISEKIGLNVTIKNEIFIYAVYLYDILLLSRTEQSTKKYRNGYSVYLLFNLAIILLGLNWFTRQDGITLQVLHIRIISLFKLNF